MSESEAGVAVIRARLNLPDADAFVRAFAPRINASGMLVRTKQIKPIGSKIRFEFSLESGERMLLGEGVVRKVKGGDQPGMTIRFTRLNQASKELIDRIVAWKEEQAALEGAPRSLRDPDEELPIPMPEGYGRSLDSPDPETPDGDEDEAPLARSAPHEGVVPASREEMAPPPQSRATVPFHSGSYAAHTGGQILQPGNVLSALESVEEDAPASSPRDRGAFSLDLDEAELDDVLGNLFGGADDGLGALFSPSRAEPSAPSFLAPVPQDDSAPAPESEDLGLRFADPSVEGEPPSLAPSPPLSDAFGALLGAATPSEEEADEPVYSDAFGALLGGAAPPSAPAPEPDDEPFDAFGALLAAAAPAEEEEAPLPLLADEADEDVVDLPPAEEEEEAFLEAPLPAQDAFGALLAGAPEPSAAPEEDDDDAFEAMMVSAASSAAEAGYPDEEEEAPPALSQTGEHRRLARLALAKAPSGEVSALAARAVGEELDADLLADAIVAASQDQSLDAGPAWPEEAAAPPRAQSSVEMFHSGDESQDDDIDIDLEALAPPPRLEPLASLQPSKGPTLSAMPRQEIASTTNSSASIRIQPTGELEGLLGRLQGRDPLDDDGDERGGELQLASAALPPLPAAPSPSPAAFDEEDDPSLEGLVSAARRGFTAQVPAVQEEAPPDAILDSLLGDAPPPPPPRPSGQLPGVPFVQPIQPFAEATQEKPKKGFLSRLFNRD